MAGPYNLMSAEYRADPYSMYRQMRTEDPVHFSEAMQMWLLTRYSDVAAAVREPKLSSRRATSFVDQLPEDKRPAMQPFAVSLSQWILFQDPPDHTRIRGLINKAFTPRMVEVVKPRILEIVDELLDEVGPKGEADLIRDLAYPLPTIVIAELLGAGGKDRALFKKWSDEIAGFIGSGLRALDMAERARSGWAEMTDYLRRVVAARRVEPKDDLISALIAAEEEQGALTDDELLSTCVLLLFAGHETTTNLIGNGLAALLGNPDSLRALAGDSGLLPTAVEELVRWDSPVQLVTRMAVDEVEIGGKKVAKGQRVMSLLGAANRDPEQFPEPDRLDLGRKDMKHLGFGYGAHFCVGAPLARAEGMAAIGRVLERMPKIALATGKLEWQPNLGFRGLKALPIKF